MRSTSVANVPLTSTDVFFGRHRVAIWSDEDRRAAQEAAVRLLVRADTSDSGWAYVRARAQRWAG